MGPGGPNMAAVGLLMLFILLSAIACWGIVWRFVVCRKRIALLPWYFSHSIAILCGLLSAITYCSFILLTLEYMPFSVWEVLGFFGVLVLFSLPVPISFFVGIRNGYLSKPQ